MTDQPAREDTPYVFRGGESGRDRLRVLARVMRAETEALLAAVNVEPGWRCLDAGCGGGDVTVELARRARPGSVVGIDLDEQQLDIARREAQVAGVDNVEYRAADLATMAPGVDPFDLVYSRFVLSHLPAPEPALATLVASCRRGGWIVVEDIDVDGSFCHPPTAAFDTYLDWYRQAHRARGGDPGLGRRLALMLDVAGIDRVSVRIAQPAGTHGDIGAIAPLTLAAAGQAIIANGIATAAQIDALVAELAALGDRPDVLVTMPRVVQAWGRRP